MNAATWLGNLPLMQRILSISRYRLLRHSVKRASVVALVVLIIANGTAFGDELREALDLLDTDLASSGNTRPAEILSAAGAGALQPLCERLHRPTMFEPRAAVREHAYTNISYVFIAMKHHHPQTMPAIVDCVFDWTLRADESDPYNLMLRSFIAVDFGNDALPALVSSWTTASREDETFSLVQKAGNRWFRVFCNQNGKEAQFVRQLADTAETLDHIDRINLYSHISSLAGCSEEAVTVIKAAFAAENDADTKRRLHQIQIQAEHVARENQNAAPN